MIFEEKNNSKQSNGKEGMDFEHVSNFINNEGIMKPSDKRQYNDSLAQYAKKGIISEDQILIVRNLLKKKDPELIKKLRWQTLSCLIKDSNPGVRRIISYSLRMNPNPEKASALLIRALEMERDWIVKEEMINSLSEIGMRFDKGNQIREEIELSILPFLSDKRHVIRMASLKAVSKLKISEAKSELNSMSILDPVLSVRLKAAQILQDLTGNNGF